MKQKIEGSKRKPKALVTLSAMIGLSNKNRR